MHAETGLTIEQMAERRGRTAEADEDAPVSSDVAAGRVILLNIEFPKYTILVGTHLIQMEKEMELQFLIL